MTRATLSIVVVALSLASSTTASAQHHVIDVQQSTVTVRVFKSGMFKALADDHVIQAPLSEGSIDDSGPPRVEIIIDAHRMRVLDPGMSAKDRQDVQTRMLGPEVLDTDRFGQIRFHSTSIEPGGANAWVVRGDLELHGQTRAMTIRVRLDNRRYKGSATLKQTDFGITPIRVAGGTVKVKDEITIEFDIATLGG